MFTSTSFVFVCKKCNDYKTSQKSTLMRHAKYCNSRLSVKYRKTYISSDSNHLSFYDVDEGIDDCVDLDYSSASTEYLNFQSIFVARNNFSAVPFKPGRILSSTGDYWFPSWKDYADIFYLQVIHNLSDTQTSEMLNRMKTILRRQGIVEEVLPSNGKTVRNLITDAMKNDYKITEVVQTLPINLFGGADLNCGQYVYVDLLQLIAEQLLRVNVDQFHFSPLRLLNGCKEKVLREPATAAMFEEYFDCVQSKMGTDYYPLCIIISADGLILNKTGTASACPWYVTLGNYSEDKIGKPDVIDCFSYSPYSRLSDKEIMAKINVPNMSKSKKEKVVKHVKYQMQMDYVREILSPILAHQEKGI